jgi:hypothetical protein
LSLEATRNALLRRRHTGAPEGPGLGRASTFVEFIASSTGVSVGGLTHATAAACLLAAPILN